MESEPAYTVIEVGGFRQPGLPLVTFSLVFLASDGTWQGSCGLELPILATEEDPQLFEQLPLVESSEKREVTASSQYGLLSRYAKEQFSVPTAMFKPPVSAESDNSLREEGLYAGIPVAEHSVIGELVLEEVFSRRLLVTRANEEERRLLYAVLGPDLISDWKRRISVESLRNFFLASPTLEAEDLTLIEALDADYHSAGTCASRALATARLFALLLGRFRELGLRPDAFFDRSGSSGQPRTHRGAKGTSKGTTHTNPPQNEARTAHGRPELRHGYLSEIAAAADVVHGQNSQKAAPDGTSSDAVVASEKAAGPVENVASSGSTESAAGRSSDNAETTKRQTLSEQQRDAQRARPSSANDFHLSQALRAGGNPLKRPQPVKSSQEYSERQRHPAALRAQNGSEGGEHPLVLAARADIQKLLDSDEQVGTVLSAMTRPSDSLESLIRDLRVSRERARSAKRAVAQGVNGFGSFRSLAQSIFVDFLPLATTNDLIRSYPGIDQPFENRAFNLLDVVIVLTPTLERRGDEVWTKGYNSQVKGVLKQCADEAGVVDLVDVAKELHLDLALVRHIVSRLEDDIVFHEDKALTKTSNYAERARAALTVLGHPMTSQQIIAFYGKGMQRSLANVLTRNPIFIRVGNDLWALKEWGLPEFTTTTDWLRKTLAESGECALPDLLDCAPSLNISPASIRSYLAGDEFVVNKGTVRLRDAQPSADDTAEKVVDTDEDEKDSEDK